MATRYWLAAASLNASDAAVSAGSTAVPAVDRGIEQPDVPKSPTQCSGLHPGNAGELAKQLGIPDSELEPGESRLSRLVPNAIGFQWRDSLSPV